MPVKPKIGKYRQLFRPSLGSANKYKVYLENLENLDSSKEFLGCYFEFVFGSNLSVKYIANLLANSSVICGLFFETTSISDSDRLHIICDSISELGFESIDYYNTSLSLQSFLRTTDVIFSKEFDASHDTINKVLGILHVVVERIVATGEYVSEVAKYVLVNNIYDITFDNIACGVSICSEDFSSDRTELLRKSFFTEIISSLPTKCVDYLLSAENIEDTFEIIDFEQNSFESESAILSILELDFIDLSLKELFLNNQTNKISTLDSVGDKRLWNCLFELSLIKPDWNNVFSFFDSMESEEEPVLDSFLDSIQNVKDLVEDKILGIADEQYKEFSKYILMNDRIDLESYRILVPFLKYYGYSNLPIDTLPEEYVSVLIENNKLAFKQSVYDKIIDISDELAIEYLVLNMNKYLEGDICVSPSILTKLMSSSIDAAKKRNILLQKIDIDDLVTSKQLSTVVSKHLITEKIIDAPEKFFNALFVVVQTRSDSRPF